MKGVPSVAQRQGLGLMGTESWVDVQGSTVLQDLVDLKSNEEDPRGIWGRSHEWSLLGGLSAHAHVCLWRAEVDLGCLP